MQSASLMHETRIWLAAWRRRGDRYHDPICGWSFDRMLTSGTGAPDAWCPRCWSAERHRLLWLYLQRETNITTDRLRLLHVAPERGLGRRLRSLPNLDYVSVDLASREALVTADLTSLPFGTEFDVVLCNHVLEHIPDDRAAMRELRRVLKPGGRAIMQHPVDRTRATTFEDWTLETPMERDHAFYQSDHVRIYGRDIELRLRTAGFDVTMIRYETSREEQERYRLAQVPGTDPSRDLEADMIYLCQARDLTAP